MREWPDWEFSCCLVVCMRQQVKHTAKMRSEFVRRRVQCNSKHVSLVCSIFSIFVEKKVTLTYKANDATGRGGKRRRQKRDAFPDSRFWSSTCDSSSCYYYCCCFSPSWLSALLYNRCMKCSSVLSVCVRVKKSYLRLQLHPMASDCNLRQVITVTCSHLYR